MAPSAPIGKGIDMAPSAPWEVGPQPVYGPVYESTSVQALWGIDFAASGDAVQVPVQAVERMQKLKEWGRRREQNMHRPPFWCMDQLVSGSGLFPPRLLAESWFTTLELQQIQQLEHVLAPTGRAAVLARDIMALK